MKTEQIPSSGRRWMLLSAAAVVTAAAVGVGIGAMIVAQEDPASAMTAEQRRLQAELQKQEAIDPGSLRFIGERDGVTLWESTSENGEKACIFLTTDDGKGGSFLDGSAACGSPDGNVLYGQDVPYASLLRPGNGEESETLVSVSRYRAASGESAFVDSSLPTTTDENSYHELIYGTEGAAEYRTIINAMELGDGGSSLNRLGMDGEVAIWSMTDWSDNGSEKEQRCLVLYESVSGGASASSSCAEAPIDETEDISISRTDDAAGEKVTYTEVYDEESGNSLLVIERENVRGEPFRIDAPEAKNTNDPED